MMRRLLLPVWLGLALMLAFGPAQAQTAANPQTPALVEDEWQRIAQRAEMLAGNPDASLFTIRRLRAELVNWREEFLKEASANSGRLDTLNAQLAALGEPPESGEEPPAVATRRAALQDQRDALLGPRLLAQEAYARANGIIAEFDARLLLEQTAELTERGPTPLNPVHLLAAVTASWQLLEFVTAETAAEISFGSETGRLWRALPRALGFLAIGLVLLSVGRRFVVQWRSAIEARETRFQPIWLFLLSFIQIVVPLTGLVLLGIGLETSQLFGLRGTAMVDRLPYAGAYLIFGWWLANHVFPSGGGHGYLGYDAETRAAGRRYTYALAWVLALVSLLEAGFTTLELDAGTKGALEFPPLVIIGALLWQLGRIIATPPAWQNDAAAQQGRVRVFVGRFCIAVAVIAPVLAALGYRWGARELMLSAILTVTLIGVILLLQRIIHEITRDPDMADDPDTAKGAFALLPVLIGIVIYVAALPVFALIWGARVEDLGEIWTRFREGFTIGETQISPTDFLMFALVFALGYLLTRIIQGTLRKSVLPRTRLDHGGQNAVVAGFGYVGIILAAIVAITSAGIDLSNIALVAGALSVGIGFGMQNIVSNFVSGIILLIERPISEGDWIEVGTHMGIVKAISVRSTRIETFDRTDVIIPNADLVSGQVTNWTRGNMAGRLIVSVGVAYGSDVDKVMAILREIAEENPMVILEPPPAVLFQGFGASSLDFEIRVILRDISYIFVVKTEINQAIAKRFKEEGVEIPFPQRDIWLRNPDVLKEVRE